MHKKMEAELSERDKECERRLEVRTKKSVDPLDVAAVGQYVFKAELFVRGDGANYRCHTDCNLTVIYMPDGNVLAGVVQPGIYVVLTSLPSHGKSTVILTDFDCNRGNVRSDPIMLAKLQLVILEGIKVLYSYKDVRIVTHYNWFDIGVADYDGGRANSWFIRQFKYPRVNHGGHAVIRAGSSKM